MQNFFKDLFVPSINSALTIENVLITLGFSLLAGVIIAVSYFIVTKNEGRSAYFITSLIVLPAVISMIISLVGSDIARAFSLGGVFALIRFRSEPGNPRDITFVCVTMAAGLACGTGYIGFGIIFVLLISLVFFLIKLVGIGAVKSPDMLLKITVPEDADFETMFEVVFEKYTKYHTLERVKTADFGSLYQLWFKVKLKDENKKKEFVDEIRVVNSNLTVSLSSAIYEAGKKTF
ncbi:MAG: DUF4956 domain-containing protein [Clostridia bacterium]|nr:DUF4956 domain-containing protein [Clostridia bacterium]